MGETIIHLLRHGEVHNPTKILYGRLPGFRLSALGEQMAARKKELLAGIKQSGLPTPETRSITGHDLEQGEPVEMAA